MLVTMIEQSANPAVGPGEMLETSGPVFPGAVGPRHGRRITAGSFHVLTVRLKGQSAIAEIVTEPAEVKWHPEPQSEVVAPPVSVASDAVEAELETALAELEIPAPPPWIVTGSTGHYGVVLPEFVPLAPVAEMPLETEPVPLFKEMNGAAHEVSLPELEPPLADFGEIPPVETVDEPVAEQSAAVFEVGPEMEAGPQAESQDLPVEASEETSWRDVEEPAPAIELGTVEIPEEIPAEPVPESVEEEPPAPVEAAAEIDEPALPPAGETFAALPPDLVPEVILPPVETAEKPHKPTSQLAGRVVEAMLKTVSDAIYTRPSAAERAAFLREVADQIESGGDGEHAFIMPPSPVEPSEAVTAREPLAEPPLENPADIPATLADRLGPSSALLRKKPGAPDPFSKLSKEAIYLASKLAETEGADEDSGELALSLLDMMSSGMGSALPQERALAADTLLRMVTRIPVRQLIAVVERLAIMDAPPTLLVAKLIRDPRAEVVAPLVERCMHITDQDLMTAATEGDLVKCRMIARRRILSTALADHLITMGEPSVLLTLIRNPGAAFSHDAFYRLAQHASNHHALLAPLTTRADLPAPVAFELFWFVPMELRRFIFSRFLTDSENLSKILKITLGTQVGGEQRFPSRELLESVIELAAKGKLEEASQRLADIANLAGETALRILSDRDGEPVTVILKALGFQRAKFAEAMERLKHADCELLREDRNIAELESIFDTLSFNKARILLTYWDWFVQKTGPYAPYN